MLSVLFVAHGTCNFVLLEMFDICVAQLVHHVPLFMFMCSLCVHVFSMCSCIHHQYCLMCLLFYVLLDILRVAQCLNVAHH